MEKYIDAEKLEKDGWSASRTYPQDAHTMVYETKKMTDFPTADVAEVVRCKECAYKQYYFTNDMVKCGCGNGAHHEDFFCADGERRDYD